MEEMIDLDEIQAGASLEAWESIDDTLDGLERHFRVTNALFLEKMAKIREEMRLFRPVPGEN